MAQKSTLSIKLFASGFCVAESSIANPQHARGKTKFYAVWALLHIPNIGYILFDTGYSNQFRIATESFPDRLYRWITPVTIDNKKTAKEPSTQETSKQEPSKIKIKKESKK